jgi:hypothetical protein
MNTNNRIEVDYYNEIAKSLVNTVVANLDNSKFVVKILIGEISSGLRTLIANGYEAGDLLKTFSKNVHKLHLDISLLVENKENGKFELVIFEVKRTKKLGLQQLSQLIGYCLVSKCKFGVLINVDNSVSGEFSVILDGDKDLTKITRIVNQEEIEHEFGVMVWNSKTQKISYTEAGEIKTIPQLTQKIVNSIKE